MEPNDRIISLLTQILDTLKSARVTLGFQESTVVPVYLNSVKCQGFLWYTVRDQGQEPIAATSFTGYLYRVECTTESRRGEDSQKLHLWMQGESGMLYRFECGWGRNTAKSILAAIATLTPEQACCPITIRPYTGNDPSVVFVRLYCDRDYIFAPYTRETDCAELLQKAQAIIRANPNNAPESSDSLDSAEDPDDWDAPPVTTSPDSPAAPTVGASTTPFPGVVDQFKVRLRNCRTLAELIELATWLSDTTAVLAAIQDVPNMRGWMLEQLQKCFLNLKLDLTDVMAATDVELRRTGWNSQQGRNFLETTYGKRSRQLLHQGELLHFLGYLKLQETALLSTPEP